MTSVNFDLYFSDIRIYEIPTTRLCNENLLYFFQKEVKVTFSELFLSELNQFCLNKL